MKFEGRKEFFGSLFWDFRRKQFFSFDENTTGLLVKGLKSGMVNGPETFLRRCQHIGLIDTEAKPQYAFIENKSTNPGVLSAPMRLHYAITANCNLNCQHCFTKDILNREGKELTFEQKINLLDEMETLGIREMLISGGEPFMSPRFPEFLEEAVKRRITVKVFTNGFLLTDSMIERIKDIPIDYLAISVDGATAYSYKQVRNGPSFDRLVAIMKKASKRVSFPLVLQITMSKANYDDLEAYFKLAIDTGVKRIKIRALKPGGAILRNNSLMLSMKEYLDFCQRALDIFRDSNYSKRYGLSMDCTLGNLRLTNINHLKIENTPQPYCGFGCVGGRITFFVDSYGYCHPCAFIDSFIDKEKAENCTSKPIKEIWDNNENIGIMRGLHGNPECISCDLYSVCRGGCRTRACYYRGDDLNGKDGWCPREAGLTLDA